MARHFTRLLSMLLTVLVAGMASAQDVAIPDAPLTQADLLRPNGIPVDFYDGLRAWDTGLHEVAVALWLRAAALGDTKSMLRVAQEYESGKYLPKQKLLAVYFKLLAKRQGHEGPDPLVGLTADERAAVTAKADEFAAAALPPAQAPQKTVTFEDLLRAADTGDADEVRRILGANSRLATGQDGKGWTPLMHAAAGGHAEIVGLLADRGSDVAAVDADGFSALHLAAWSGSEATVALLLARGAFPVAASAKGMTASIVAERAKHPEVAAQLAAAERRQVVQIQEKLATLGYEVGKADGEMGPRTATQLAIFAAGERLPGPPTANVLAKLFAKTETRLWGAVVLLNYKGTPSATYYTNAVGNRARVETAILDWCKGQPDWSKCKISVMLPQGTCLAGAIGSGGGVIWSRAFPELASAEADSEAQCRSAGSTGCKVTQSFCVRE